MLNVYRCVQNTVQLRLGTGAEEETHPEKVHTGKPGQTVGNLFGRDSPFTAYAAEERSGFTATSCEKARETGRTSSFYCSTSKYGSGIINSILRLGSH